MAAAVRARRVWAFLRSRSPIVSLSAPWTRSDHLSCCASLPTRQSTVIDVTGRRGRRRQERRRRPPVRMVRIDGRLEGHPGRRRAALVGRPPLPRGDLTDAYPPAGVSALPQLAQRPRPSARASAAARASSRSWATLGGNGQSSAQPPATRSRLTKRSSSARRRRRAGARSGPGPRRRGSGGPRCPRAAAPGVGAGLGPEAPDRLVGIDRLRRVDADEPHRSPCSPPSSTTTVSPSTTWTTARRRGVERGGPPPVQARGQSRTRTRARRTAQASLR